MSTLKPQASSKKLDPNRQKSRSKTFETSPKQVITPDLSINRRDWLIRVIREHSEIADLRERLTPLNRAISFVNTYDKGRRRGQMPMEDIVNLIYQYFHYEGLHEVCKIFVSEAGDYKIKLRSTGDVRLLTLLRLVIQWTERLWDLAINDKKMDPAKVNQWIEDQLLQVNLLRIDKDQQLSVDAAIGVSIWDEPREGNIIYEDTNGVESTSIFPQEGLFLRAATLNKLVEEITPIVNVNNNFVNIFLLTYRSFTTPDILLVKLRQRYEVPREENEDDQAFKSKALPIQLRVINFVKMWLDNCYSDLTNKFIAELKDFVDTKLTRDHLGQAKSILQIVEKQEKVRNTGEEEKPNFIFNKPPDPPIIPKGGRIFLPDLDWMEIDALELARQLTLIEYEMLKRIRPSEFLQQAWNKPKLKHLAKNLSDYIEYFNKLSTWCSTKIIHPLRIKQRVKSWIKLISVADYCYQLRNFNSLMAILGSFMNAPVYRLKHTRNEIPQQYLEKWKELYSIMDAEGGYYNYRRELEKTTSSCIPYLGVFLTDLTFTEDGNDDDYKGLINFTKRKLVGQIIEKIINFQKPYNLQPVYQIQVILRTLKPRFGEEDMYNISFTREPRKIERSELQ